MLCMVFMSLVENSRYNMYMSVKLSVLAQGKNNNFNIIRIVCALTVLFTHSFALAIGSSAAEPFRETLGMTLGLIAVDVFFITSGFLVTASLLVRKSVVEYVWARMLRVYPALFVMLILSVFLVGSYFTVLPLDQYLTAHKTYNYFVKCFVLFSGVKFNLPGVFLDNPYQNAVNGSLWTMPYEVKMYVFLAVVWLLSSMLRERREKIFGYFIVCYALCSAVYVLMGHFLSFDVGYFTKLSFMFFTGASFYVLKEHIYLSSRLFCLLLVVLFLLLQDAFMFYIVYVVSVSYVLFYLAYKPSGFIRKYNGIGDYSYGVYIYAFPVQQSIVALFPGITVTSLILLSSIVTIILAVLSWNLLEKRAVSLKEVFSGNTKKIVAYSMQRLLQKS